jgi:glycosyltransferase involved in cell wall biosynthesis
MLENLAATKSQLTNHRLKIAWLSPFPPQKSGIANYSYWLLKELRPAFDIDLFYEGEPPSADLQNDFAAYPMKDFAERRGAYDRTIYHLGNSCEFHKKIYELAWNFPGIVVLHDYDLSVFIHDAFFRENYSLYKQALPDGSDKENARGPTSHAVVSRSKKVIVHHRWVRNQFAENGLIQVIPHFAKLNCEPTAEDVREFRAKLGIRDDHFVLACLGFINPNKLPQLQINVVKQLLDAGYPVQMVFAGEPDPQIRDLVNEIRSSEYRANVIFTGYQSEMDYFSSIFAADVIINLRNPSMGEASGTLMHSLAAARPTIISDANQYREFPDKVCWKLLHDENQAKVLYEYLKVLLSDVNLRTAISENSAQYAKSVLGLEKIRDQWANAILG